MAAPDKKHKCLVHLDGAQEGSLLKPFYAWAISWYEAAAQEVAGQNGGRCGVLASSVLSSAAAALAWERYMFTRAAQNDEIGMARLALQFGDSARKSIAALQSLNKGPQGFVDPLAEDEPEVDPKRAEKLHKEMKKALAKSNKSLQAEPAWANAPPADLDDLFGPDEPV